MCYPYVLFPSFDFNFIVHLRCCVSVSSGRWLLSIFLSVSEPVPPKGSVARSSSYPILSVKQRYHAPRFSFFRDFDLSSFTTGGDRSSPFRTESCVRATGQVPARFCPPKQVSSR
jgi:hypothetical protein